MHRARQALLIWMLVVLHVRCTSSRATKLDLETAMRVALHDVQLQKQPNLEWPHLQKDRAGCVLKLASAEISTPHRPLVSLPPNSNVTARQKTESGMQPWVADPLGNITPEDDAQCPENIMMSSLDLEVYDIVLEAFRNGSYLEWGSGGSTIHAASRISHITSIEHDLSWCHMVKRCMDSFDMRNVDYFCATRSGGEVQFTTPDGQVIKHHDRFWDGGSATYENTALNRIYSRFPTQ